MLCFTSMMLNNQDTCSHLIELYTQSNVIFVTICAVCMCSCNDDIKLSLKIRYVFTKEIYSNSRHNV